MRLFIIYIGGEHQNSLIELHDIRFVVANTIEETYPELRKNWWGIPASLHLDCWGILKYVDGYEVLLKKFPAENKNKLYFVNVGGYDALQFTELHKNFCVVATDEIDAKKNAMKQILDWESPHKDYLHTVESIFNVQNTIEKQKLYLHLEATQNPSPFNFTCKYVPIGV